MIFNRPKVSIGLPVYNGDKLLPAVLDSLLSQSYADFELIISDNCSTDRTSDICREYAKKEPRIRYIRQPLHIAAMLNFKAVLDHANAEYFMWAAADDFRSLEFLQENIQFLEAHPEYVASTCPNCFYGEEAQPEKTINFSLDGELSERYITFLNNCWKSHGIFYSIIRTGIIRKCDLISSGKHFTAADWAVDFFLASHGKVHRTKAGLTVFGTNGASSSSGSWRSLRDSPIELIFPFYRFTLYALRLMTPLSSRQWLRVSWLLLLLNMKAGLEQAKAELYAFYCRYLRSGFRKLLNYQ